MAGRRRRSGRTEPRAAADETSSAFVWLLLGPSQAGAKRLPSGTEGRDFDSAPCATSAFVTEGRAGRRAG